MLSALTAEMFAGQVETLFILGGNPVFDAPSDLDFFKALSQVRFSLALANSANAETSEATLLLKVRTAFTFPGELGRCTGLRVAPPASFSH